MLAQTGDLFATLVYTALDNSLDLVVEDDSVLDHTLDYSVSDWLDYMTD